MVSKGSVNARIPELSNSDAHFGGLCPPPKDLHSGQIVKRSLAHASPSVVKVPSGEAGAFFSFLGISSAAKGTILQNSTVAWAGNLMMCPLVAVS